MPALHHPRLVGDGEPGARVARAMGTVFVMGVMGVMRANGRVLMRPGMFRVVHRQVEQPRERAMLPVVQTVQHG